MALRVKSVLKCGPGIKNITLGRHKHQNVAAGLPTERLDGIAGLIDILYFLANGLLKIFDGDGKGPARDLENQRIVKVAAEFFGINSGRGNDQFQVRPFGQQLFKIAQEKINIQASFMGLVNDDGVVALEQAVSSGFGQQNAVGHEFDSGAFPGPVLKADRGTNQIRSFEFLGHPFGHGDRSQTARLGAADDFFFASAGVKTHLGQLGGLAGTGITGNNQDLILADCGNDTVFFRGYGKIFRIVQIHFRSECRKKGGRGKGLIREQIYNYYLRISCINSVG